MSKITIEWLSDVHDCETCGASYAGGAVVRVDGEVVIDLKPHAACFDGNDWSEEEIYRRIFAHFGHELDV